MSKNYDWLLDDIVKDIARLGIKIAVALLILSIGFWIANKITNWLEKRMIKKEVGISARTFIKPIVNISLKIIIILSAINTVGIEITGLTAAIAGAFVGIGMALQGSLSNFAGGILIIIFKPFKIGDYIESQGQSGTVESINILYTTIVNLNQQVIVLPNSAVLSNPVKNYSIKPTRRLDISVGISYDDDFKMAQEVLLNMLKEEPLLLKDQPFTVEIVNFGDNSVDLAVRAFSKREDYWTALYNANRRIKEVLDENGISIPYPQRDLHVTYSPKNNEA